MIHMFERLFSDRFNMNSNHTFALEKAINDPVCWSNQ